MHLKFRLPRLVFLNADPSDDLAKATFATMQDTQCSDV